VSTAGTAVTGTAASGYQNANQAYQSLNALYQGAQNMGQLLTQTMTAGGINLNNSTDLNLGANTLASRLSSPDYAKFVSTLTNTANQYQSILTNNGATTPTAADQSLLQILNPNSSIGAITAALNQLNQEVYTGKLLPAQALSNNYLSTAQGGNSNGTTNTNTPNPWN
jgi:hypothetical protein